MIYKTKLTSHDGYIEVTAEGTQSFEGNAELADYCVSQCVKTGIKRVLLDIKRLKGQPGVIADYQLSKLINPWVINGPVAKTAMVEDKSQLESGKFFETAARNHGADLMVFADKKEALSWLLS